MYGDTASVATRLGPVGGGDLGVRRPAAGAPLGGRGRGRPRRDAAGRSSLVSRASLDRLREEAGVDEAVDGRRFRMLFEIDGVDAHEEDTWIGAEVRIGEAMSCCNGDIGRCVVTTRDPDTGVADLATLERLAGYRREGVIEPLPFGVYGDVAVPGRVRVGEQCSRAAACCADIAELLYWRRWQHATAAPS